MSRLKPSRAASIAARLALAVGFLAAAAVIPPAGLRADEAGIGGLTIDHPWTRATPAGAKVAGGFMVIRNAGPEPDRLVGGDVPFADKVEVHEMSMDGDVMRMRQLPDGLAIPAGSDVVLKPGSLHLMFIGLGHGLKEGDRVAGTLHFEKAGSVDVEFDVGSMGATEPGGADGHGSHAQ